MKRTLEYLGLNDEQIAYLKSNPETKALLQSKGWISPPITKKIKVMQENGMLSSDIYFGTDAKYIDVSDSVTGTETTLEEVLIALVQTVDETLNNLIGGSY